MSFLKALKYAVRQKKFETLRKLGALAEHDDEDNESENDNNGIKILKKTCPTVIDGESQMSENYFKSFGLESQTHNPFIEFYENQAKTGQRQTGFY